MSSFKILALGEGALLCEAGASASLLTQRRVWHVASQAHAWPHVIDAVCGMNNLTVMFDPLTTDTDALAMQLHEAWQSPPPGGETGREIDIAVAYGGSYGPDLVEVARHTKLSPKTVVQRHAKAEYIVYFLGFQPGFAYLGGLDPSLATPRHPEPRLSVPAGAVGIGGSQTGIYPIASPGGWQLIGRTEATLFDVTQDPPTLLAPGDRLRFSIASLDL